MVNFIIILKEQDVELINLYPREYFYEFYKIMVQEKMSYEHIFILLQDAC